MTPHLLPGSSRADLKKGLLTLNSLWSAGSMPSDLDRHMFLTWFALSRGRITRAVKKMGLHRNTFNNYLIKLNFARKAVHIRKIWLSLDDGKGEATFNSRMHTYYKKLKSSPSITRPQNDALVRLWRTGFTNKILPAHYILWAIREGKSREWLRKKFDFSNRHLIRLISWITKPGTRENFWLSPLNPKEKELYLPRYWKRL